MNRYILPFVLLNAISTNVWADPKPKPKPVPSPELSESTYVHTLDDSSTLSSSSLDSESETYGYSLSMGPVYAAVSVPDQSQVEVFVYGSKSKDWKQLMSVRVDDNTALRVGEDVTLQGSMLAISVIHSSGLYNNSAISGQIAHVHTYTVTPYGAQLNEQVSISNMFELPDFDSVNNTSSAEFLATALASTTYAWLNAVSWLDTNTGDIQVGVVFSYLSDIYTESSTSSTPTLQSHGNNGCHNGYCSHTVREALLLDTSSSSRHSSLSVAVDGTLAAVGLPDDTTTGPSAGAVHFFAFGSTQDSNTTQRSINTAWRVDSIVYGNSSEYSTEGYAHFGCSVATESSLAVVGAYGGSDSIAGAFVYRRQFVYSDDDSQVTGAWAWVLESILSPSDYTDGNLFGFSLGIFDGMIFVGAPGSPNSNGLLIGAVYSFYPNSTVAGKWDEHTKYLGRNDTSEYFGSGVAGYNGLLFFAADPYRVVASLGSDDDSELVSGRVYTFGHRSTSKSSSSNESAVFIITVLAYTILASVVVGFIALLAYRRIHSRSYSLKPDSAPVLSVNVPADSKDVEACQSPTALRGAQESPVGQLSTHGPTRKKGRGNVYSEVSSAPSPSPSTTTFWSRIKMMATGYHEVEEKEPAIAAPSPSPVSSQNNQGASNPMRLPPVVE
mmetsp:Transcript_10382/g.15781  ORF Transcript_10382/g.15781 Transcript_10382/m.15781 type:complete len:666 (+) Transcript_10382:136-2133(+)|eukprot:CAMPEP_0185034668 /NCGR_PEP_ID=MMETSP1103-20130426/24747_1 /TAXON_ID=36769 /ORGANISM="Paraphysomonas bandaiensis, Strain Caron Lab Isolate" /LENGTH=665 /DNA_ID=CAMNT_0027571413 /DNA_START=78 /DNA_END=2075 /DNA_ORIENTATION=+